MATINISDIRPAGYDLLFDAENYTEDLSGNELNRVVGGTEPITLGVIAFSVVAGAGVVGYAVGLFD